ncbi:AMP-binding protein [Hydrogenophaga sp. BPS33]|uniref:AMP-binding protein n=1 Tax=Hydrogenophaga sp. BPS33 TaxID=2651974 RepID=UPI00131FCA27|nr:AMP-binding protein [Hydrogenophaga sp. BPS33]QHE83712.1 ATP-dependent acyl-CoA ligase [Hydrogenophaga sp. BPS33]
MKTTVDPVTSPFEGAQHHLRADHLGALLLERVALQPTDTALRMVDGEDWTWSRLAEEVGAIQAGLARMGLEPGDSVALMCENAPRMVAALCAVTAAGLVAVPVNTAQVGAGLAFVLEHSGASVLIADAPYLERCASLGLSLPGNRCIATEADAPSWRQAFGREAAPMAHGSTADTAMVMYTSGTTGVPKGVMLDHGCVLTGAHAAAAVMLEATPQTVIHTCLPLFHCAAQQLGLWPALLSGAQLVLARRFSASGFWPQIQRYRANAFHFVGPMTSVLWKAPPSSLDRRHGARIAVGGGPRIAWRAFEERFGVQFVECYGMTETFGGCVAHRPGRNRAGSVGKAMGHVEVEVRNEAGTAVSAGTVGEIAIRARVPHALFQGYFQRADLTAEAVRGGWYHTGDLGAMDADGYLTYHSRARDLIRRRGENVSAIAVEEAINACDGVLECGVVGVPSALGEEDILAVLVPDPSKPRPTWPELLDAMRTRLPAFALPRYLCFAEELPKTVTGRLQRHLLRPMAAQAFDLHERA